MKAYITSCTTGRGEWVEFPTTVEDLQAACDRLGGDEFFAADYDAAHVDPYEVLGEFVDLEKMNTLAELDEMLDGSISSLLNAASELDAFDLVEDVVDAEEAETLAKAAIEERGLIGLSYFLGQVHDMKEDYFVLDGYGNLQNFTAASYKNTVAKLANRAA